MNNASGQDIKVADAASGNWVDRFVPDTLRPYARLARLDRPIGWWLLLIPCWWGQALAELGQVQGTPNLWYALLFLIGAIVMRGAGCTLNDIADREADRRHARKRRRPFASGELKPAAGWAVAAALLALAATIAITLLLAAATIALGGYVILAMSYSFAIKRRVGLDVAVLAVLYAVRILAGGAATGIEVSSWLLALSLALFASLALAKRHAEVREAAPGSADRLPGRGYRPRDLGWLRVAGIVCGAAASAGLVFYAASLSGVRYYARPGWLYVLAPIVLVWVLRVWTRAAGGRMHDDPLVDAMTDLPGLALVATGVLVFVAAF